MKLVCYFDGMLSMEMDVWECKLCILVPKERLTIMFYYRSSKYDKKNVFIGEKMI